MTLRASRPVEARIITADDFLERADLELVAVELIEDPRYNRLEPEAAADQHRRDTF